MKPPKNNKEVSKFLGMDGWYHIFIPNYADIREPLYRLKKKGAQFNWFTEANDSFNKAKRALTEAPVLQVQNFQEKFNLFTDASGVGIGSVLNHNQRLFTFASRTLNKAERNYSVTERECLAVIWALNKFRTYFGVLPVKNAVADILARNPVDNVEGSQISCATLRALALNSREQLIQEQREDPELGHIYRYLENPDDSSVNATLCEGRKIITPFRKLVRVTDGAEYVGGNIEKLFEARQNMQRQHKTWEKYYNRKRRAVNIKVNDLVLVQTHFISAAGSRVVGKFRPKFEGPYRVLEVQKNNLTIWKRGRRDTVNIDQVRIYPPKIRTQTVLIVLMRRYMRERDLVVGLIHSGTLKTATQEESIELK
ncbi:retrovirus-related Pol polyprotein from transposon 17.6 [Trichonephila clavipes]|nr:retrovirus-related Pol polyprotein from transposon 17.6 [Trichonephila clavipes]